MWLTSTNRKAPAVSFADALLNGIAPDGGLYLPTAIPACGPEHLAAWRGQPFGDVACELAAMWLHDEFPRAVIDELVGTALDFPVPLVPLEGRLSVLELFHGPTMAFKDVGARFLARFFGHVLASRGEHATILVATSGDTGSAVARGFAGVAGVRVVVLYPGGKVSPFQESQMATIGGNVTAVRVPGTFDDCQRLVKTAFPDPALRPLRLSSANSINIGRLLPQSFYYVAACLAATSSPDEPVVFSVPSGNLGNLTAGLLAAAMGLPVHRFVAATNINDVLPEYLTTGAYRPRPSVTTISNAMDVGDPSNFVRATTLTGSTLDGMRARVDGEMVTDADTRAEMRDTYVGCRYVLDPHGAVGCRAARRWMAANRADMPVIVLATAHPAKFAEVITRELGIEPELPAHERGWRQRPLLVSDLPDAASATLKDFLLSLPNHM
jgi:threonine synthase